MAKCGLCNRSYESFKAYGCTDPKCGFSPELAHGILELIAEHEMMMKQSHPTTLMPDYVPLPDGTVLTNTPRPGDTPEQLEARLSRDPSRGVLNERGGTHGDFEENGKIMQALKAEMRGHWGWEKLSLYQREALEMIQHKIGRILCGDNNYFDHWRDIAGYAKLVEERCPKK